MSKDSEVTWISSERSRRAKSAVAVTLSLAVILSMLGFVSWVGYDYYLEWRQREDYIGQGDDPVQVVIDKGLGWGRVADLLLVKDVVKDPDLFVKEALKLAEGPSPGTWNLKTHLPALTAATLLTDTTNRLELHLTIPEGRRIADIYGILIEKLGVSQGEIDEAIETIEADPSIIGLHPAAKTNLEGFLFPDTYILYPPIDTDILSVFERMANQFNQVIDELDLEKRAKALKISVKDAVTVASIIEAEVSRDEDRPKAARVVFNRLKIKMNLQMDSTVNYGLKRSGQIYIGDEETKIDTPYNTYIHSGLPPTPISCPGRDSLEAAVNPAKGAWLYWTTVNLETGETRFAKTIEEHQANGEIFSAWCRENPGVCQ